MPELDLDAIQKGDALAAVNHSFARVAPEELSALIQRVREAEYDRDVIAPSSAADVEALHEANGRLHDRIARLERVREAAQEVLSSIDHDGSDEVGDALRAALADCSHNNEAPNSNE